MPPSNCFSSDPHRGSSLRRVKNGGGSKWKVKEISLEGGGVGGSGNKENDGGNKSNRNSANLSGTEVSPALMAQANWAFVEKLLKVGTGSVDDD